MRRTPAPAAQRDLVDVPGGLGGVLPAPACGGGRPGRGFGGTHERVEVVVGEQLGPSSSHLAHGRHVAGRDRGAAGQRLDRCQAEALVAAREHDRVRARVDRGEVVIGHLAGQRHVRQFLRPRAARPDQHQWQRALGPRQRRDPLVRVRGLQSADPQQILVGQRVASTHRRRARRWARAEDRRRRLGDHLDPLGRDLQRSGSRRRPPPWWGRSREPRAGPPGSAAASAGHAAAARPASSAGSGRARVTTIGTGECSSAPSSQGEW